MSYYSDLGAAISSAFVTMGILLIIFIPLGLWKLIEIIYWLYTHIQIGWI